MHYILRIYCLDVMIELTYILRGSKVRNKCTIFSDEVTEYKKNNVKN
jgi:hypothetical protein